MGIFSAVVIKKRRYWPKYVPGGVITEHMKDMAVGATDSLKGIIDDIPYDIFCMKTPEYVMKLILTYRGFKESNWVRTNVVWLQNGVPITFLYTKCFANYFDFRHGVDDHNHLRHASPTIEETWHTQR